MVELVNPIMYFFFCVTMMWCFAFTSKHPIKGLKEFFFGILSNRIPKISETFDNFVIHCMCKDMFLYNVWVVIAIFEGFFCLFVCFFSMLNIFVFLTFTVNRLNLLSCA